MKIAVIIPDFSEVPTEDYSPLHINELSTIDDASCEDLFLGDCMDYVANNRDALVETACSKIKYGGRIVLTGSDLHEVCKAKAASVIDEDRVNEILYSGRTGLTSAMTLVDKITKKGLINSSRRVNGFRYTLIFERPLPNENAV